MRTAVLQRVLTFLVSENHTKVEKKNTEEVEESKNRKYRIHQAIVWLCYYIQEIVIKQSCYPILTILIITPWLTVENRVSFSPSLSLPPILQFTVITSLESLFSSSVTCLVILFKYGIRNSHWNKTSCVLWLAARKNLSLEAWLQNTKQCFCIISVLLDFTKWLVTAHDWAIRCVHI